MPEGIERSTYFCLRTLKVWPAFEHTLEAGNFIVARGQHIDHYTFPFVNPNWRPRKHVNFFMIFTKFYDLYCVMFIFFLLSGGPSYPTAPRTQTVDIKVETARDERRIAP